MGVREILGGAMAKSNLQEVLKRIPGVDEMLKLDAVRAGMDRHPRGLVVESIRRVLDAKRKEILERPEAVRNVDLDPSRLVALVMDDLEARSRFTLQPVINATGIVIHTNLGRSLLPRAAVERLQLLCTGYSNLEYDLEKGRRGSRYVHAESILREITGAEGALVVNNNAGAVLLVLNTLASGREVVVSRGQLVEIGGSFRIPDVMRSSGAILREVGCTNRTHPRDYESAVNDQTALLLKVHCSNYKIIGFTSEISLEELVELGRRKDLPVMEDLGSGSFVDFSQFGLQHEPTVQETIRAGVDVVTFSGDKLLGGPQAGVIVGRKDIIERCKKNPLTRALRVDKMTLAALEAVLRLYRDERQALDAVPTLRMITTPLSVLEERAQDLATALTDVLGSDGPFQVEVMRGLSQVGGGSLPEQNIPTRVVAVQSLDHGPNRIEEYLRRYTPPIIGRIEDDRFLMDVRTLRPEDLPVIRQAFDAMV